MGKGESHERLKQMLDAVLLSEHEHNIHNLFNTLSHRAQSEGITFDGPVLLEYWWGLARCGIVAVPGGPIGTMRTFKMPEFMLTERGRKLLQHGEQSPHNPSKYLSAVRARVTEPDDVVLSYVEESVEAWRSGLFRSSAVMLGCACERLVLMLARTIAEAGLPTSSRLAKKLEGRVFVSALFDDVRRSLMSLSDDKQLPPALADALDRKLSAIFDHARGLRNQSGHPTGEIVTAEDAEAGLLLFPGFYELADKLIHRVLENAAGR